MKKQYVNNMHYYIGYERTDNPSKVVFHLHCIIYSGLKWYFFVDHNLIDIFLLTMLNLHFLFTGTMLLSAISTTAHQKLFIYKNIALDLWTI